MRFRLVDRILSQGDGCIRTRKMVSFEEFSLLKPWRRKGAFPESLILQVAVESAALLLAASSNGLRTGALESLQEARFLRETKPGSVLECEIRMEDEAYRYQMEDQWSTVATGLLTLRELPLESCEDPEAFALMRAAMTSPVES